MGLITKEVEIILHKTNIKHFENLGYEIPKYENSRNQIIVKQGTKILIKVRDLPDGSHIKVQIKCDGCDKKLKNVKWQNYKKQVRLDNKYYCRKCANSRVKKWISFEQWCIENNREDILDRWDYELNKYKPNKIAYGTNKKYYFKCPKNLHKSELKIVRSFTNGQEGSINCKACNSFAQWGIDNIGDDFLEKYWDYEKNTVDPWAVAKRANKPKVWIRCQKKDYHGSYDIVPDKFILNNRCAFCSNGKIHLLDSLGKLLEDKNLLHLWSDKNKKSPYEYAPKSNKDVWWKCPEGKHEDYPRKINVSNRYGFRCPSCKHSEGEGMIEQYLILYFIKYLLQHKFLDCKYKQVLKFDFYLPDYNMCIEYQGIQHYESIDFAGKGQKWAEEQFKINQIKDQIKRDYCKNNNIKLIEIPYWDFDRIEEILDKELVKLSIINSKSSPILCVK